MITTNLHGQVYTPAKQRQWLTEKARADFAEIFDCEPGQVEFHLDARDAKSAKQARLEAIGNLPTWFEALDHFDADTDGERAQFLANEWSVYGEEISEQDEHDRLFDAALVVAEWRFQKLDNALAALAEPLTVATVMGAANLAGAVL